MRYCKVRGLLELYMELSEYHVRLLAYAKQAHRELYANIARLFEALAFSKKVQAVAALKSAGYIKSTKENIADCIRSGSRCIAEENDALVEDNEIDARSKEIEEKCQHLYVCAYDALESGNDLNIETVDVCSKCGFTVLGDAPGECPVCHSPSGWFRQF